MIGIVIFLISLLFTSFLVKGIMSAQKKSAGKYLYFSLATISLLCFTSFLFFPNWTVSTFGLWKTHNSPQTETTTKDTPPYVSPDNFGDTPSEEVTSPVVNPNDEKKDIPAPIESKEIKVSANEMVKYKISAGDTLYSISKRSNIPIDKIQQWNNLSSNQINERQILVLYGKNVEPSSPSKPPKEKTQAAIPSKLISNGNTKDKKIALTFDAGSDVAGIEILDILKKHQVKATFFLTGKWVEKYPEYAKRIVNDGYDIGNHSYSHPDAVKLTAQALKADIQRSEQIIREITKKSPKPYFRFPYGSYNNATLRTVGDAGYPYSIQWSLDTIDWRQPPAAEIVARIKANASNGDIILMHIGGVHTPEAVDKAIPWLKANGFQIVSLTELLN